jgi:hypothetical protein
MFAEKGTIRVLTACRDSSPQRAQKRSFLAVQLVIGHIRCTQNGLICQQLQRT